MSYDRIGSITGTELPGDSYQPIDPRYPPVDYYEVREHTRRMLARHQCEQYGCTELKEPGYETCLEHAGEED
jgi:hypothetical protein